jgi:hypothetical protein
MRDCVANRVMLVGICLTLLATFIAVIPILTTKPDERARRHWEKEYASLLPRNYSDFQAHWQSQDTGVRIFSFRCPENMTEDQILRHLTDGPTGFNATKHRPSEVVIRRPVTYSDPAGFDEFRFVYRPRRHRVFGLFANLDSETSVHEELIKKLDDLAGPIQ